jgi:cytochrome c-type biogenesis protein CcmF
MLLTNNVLLVVAAGSVLLGTLYPLALDALGLGKISVGPPYFETVFAPLMVPALILMGVGPIARWKSASLPDLATRLKWSAAASLVVALVLPLTTGKWTWGVSAGLLLAAWIAFTTLAALVHRLRSSSAATLMAKLRSSSSSYYGMLLAHMGVAVFVVGVTMVRGYGSETDVRMEPGQTAQLAGYTFRFEGAREVEGPNYVAARGTIEVLKGERRVAVMYPEKRIYTVQQMPMTEAAIDSGFTRDLYVAMGEAVSPTAWVVRIWVKPFVDWIWFGCVIMALGGLLAASDRRYRIAARAAAQGAARPVDAAPAPEPVR